GIHRTNKKSGTARLVGSTFAVAVKQTGSLSRQSPVLGDDGETPAVINVEMRQVKRKKVQFLAINQHHLAVVADQVVGSPGDGDSRSQKPQFEFAQISFAAPVGIRDESAYRDTSLNCLLEGSLQIHPIETEDHDLYTLLCPLNSLDQRFHAVSWL